ncbi:MAG: beta-N-acetylglucosaminidase, partial [Eudoraea sp.]|nr:beta-N-acetylglucosaminidase [Eudoraea sp.]
MRNYLLFYIFCFTILWVKGQSNPLMTADSLLQKKWVDTTYEALSPEQKIGQLFMVMVASGDKKINTDRVKAQIENYHLGGLIFSNGGPLKQARLTNEYQRASGIPLLIGMDAEWGLAMRLDSTYAFPWNMTLGAIRDSTVVEKVGYRIGMHAKRLGVHINFAPDIDINTNPRNPIIGNRSFGEDKENVARNGIAFMKGMAAAGVLTSGKHFPGHGDTATDSHKALPVIEFTRERLDSVELYPFKRLIKEGLNSVMVAHLEVPALESKKEKPSSLSSDIVTELLK